MFKKYPLVGLSIVLLLICLVVSIRIARGSPKAFEIEPWKVKGAPNARVYILEFSDFACPYCNVLRPKLRTVLDEFPSDLKIIFKHFPLSIHPNSHQAAEASECAADQNKFWDYHDVLFDRVSDWNNEKDLAGKFTAYAKELGLDEIAFRQCFDSGVKKAVVDKNKKEGRSMFVSGTPTCLLNGKKVFTKHDPDFMIPIVKSAIERAKIK